MKLFLFVLVVVAIIFGVVTFQNNTEISVQFIKWNFTEHIAIVLAVAFAVGLLAGLVLLIPAWWKKASQARHLKKRIHELEEAKESPEDEVEGDLAEEKPEESAVEVIEHNPEEEIKQ